MAKLRHLAITVPDPEKAAEFYIQAFGLKRVGTTDWEGAQGVYLTDGVMNLALLHYKKEHYAGKLGREFVGGLVATDACGDLIHQCFCDELAQRLTALGGLGLSFAVHPVGDLDDYPHQASGPA